MQKKALELEIVFINVIKYLDVYDFLNLSSCNMNFYKYFSKNYIWKEKNSNIIDLNQKIDNYKLQYIINFNSKNRNKCSICNDYIIQDFYISTHDCNYGFTKCTKCLKSSFCICGDYVSYHSKCINKENLFLIECPLCKTKIAAYHINYNI